MMNAREFERIMKRNGYSRMAQRGKGSHVVYRNGNGRTLSIGDNYNKMVIKRLIKEYALEI